MTKRHGGKNSFVLFFALCASAVAQFNSSEIAERPKWEEFLKTAEIIDSKPIGDGVTKPFRLTLKKGEVVRDAAWKNPHDKPLGVEDEWRYEIAAYELDKLLELQMIPPTVKREFKKKEGALSLWAEYEVRLLEVTENNIPVPPEYQDRYDKEKYIVRAFDALIANEDRTMQNILFTKDWRAIIIDHSRSFRTSKEFTEKLVTGKNAPGRPMPIRRLPRRYFERIKSLTFGELKKALGPHLDDKQISAILIRRELLVKELDETIKQEGEASVLY